MSDEPYPDWAFDDMNVALDAAVARAEAAEARVRVLEEMLQEACDFTEDNALAMSLPADAVKRMTGDWRMVLDGYTPAPVEMPGDVHPQEG